MINLTRFTKDIPAALPIVGGWGQVYGRKVYQPSLADGWYSITLGNSVKVHGKASQLAIESTIRYMKPYRLYAYGTEGVPLNFDNFHKLGLGETIPVHFMNLQPFQVAKAIRWEDDRFYFWEADVRAVRVSLQRVKEAFEGEQSIRDTKYLSPEIRYYFLLLSMQRQQLRHLEELEQMRISDEEKRKRLEEFRATFAGRLQATIEQAGGSLVKFTKSRGNTYLVEWRIGGQTVKSQISDDLRIVSAGFCLSGDDVRHSMASIVNLASLYQEDAPLYITRE